MNDRGASGVQGHVLAPLDSAIAAFDQRYQRRVGEARALATQGKEATERHAALSGRLRALDEAAEVLLRFGEQRQAEIITRVESLVTHGLQTVFGEVMTFHIVAEQKAKAQQYEFTVRSRLGERTIETPVLDARGGGVAVVVSFLLRLLLVLLRRDTLPVLVLDESFAQLSEEYVPRLAEFIRQLVDSTDVQVILVTHDPTFAEYVDAAYRFDQADGVTKVSRLAT